MANGAISSPFSSSLRVLDRFDIPSKECCLNLKDKFKTHLVIRSEFRSFKLSQINIQIQFEAFLSALTLFFEWYLLLGHLKFLQEHWTCRLSPYVERRKDITMVSH